MLSLRFVILLCLLVVTTSSFCNAPYLKLYRVPQIGQFKNYFNKRKIIQGVIGWISKPDQLPRYKKSTLSKIGCNLWHSVHLILLLTLGENSSLSCKVFTVKYVVFVMPQPRIYIWMLYIYTGELLSYFPPKNCG